MSNIDKLLYIEGIGEITQNLNIGGNLNVNNCSITVDDNIQSMQEYHRNKTNQLSFSGANKYLYTGISNTNTCQLEIQSDWFTQLKLQCNEPNNNGEKSDICFQHNSSTIGTKAHIQLNTDTTNYFLDFIMNKPTQSTNPVGFKFRGGDMQLDNNLIVSGISTFNNNISIKGNIIPTEDNTYTLGSTTKAFKDVYIGPGSLYINGKKILEQEESTDSNITTTNITTEPDNHIKIKTSGAGTIQLQSEDEVKLLCNNGSNGNINIENTSTNNGNINIQNSSNGNITLNSNGDINIEKANVGAGDINIKNLSTSTSDNIEIETKGGDIILNAGSPENPREIELTAGGNTINVSDILTQTNLNSLSTLTVNGTSTFNENVTIASDKTLTVNGISNLNDVIINADKNFRISDNKLYFRGDDGNGGDNNHSIGYSTDSTMDGVEIRGWGSNGKAYFRVTRSENNNILIAGYNDRLQIYKNLTVDGSSTFNDVTIASGKTLTVNGTSNLNDVTIATDKTLTINKNTIIVNSKEFTFPSNGGTLALADSSGSGTFDQPVTIINDNTLTVTGTSTFNNNIILNKSGINEPATIEVQSDWYSQLKLYSTHEANNGFKCDICLQHDNNTIGTKANIQLNADTTTYFLDFIMSKPPESTNPVGFNFSGGDMQLNNNLIVSGTSTFNDNLYINNGHLYANNISVNGAGNTNSEIYFHDNVRVINGKSLIVSGTSNLNDVTITNGNTLTVNGTSTFNENVTIATDKTLNFGSAGSVFTDSNGNLKSETFTSFTWKISAGSLVYQADRNLVIYDIGGGVRFASNSTGPSDRELKENIADLETTESIDVVKQLKTYRYNYIGDTEKTPQIGFMADEMKPLIPECIKTFTNQDKVSNLLYKENIVPHLVNTIQSLLSKVELLESRIQVLEGSNST